MRRIATIASLACVLAAPASAHDFWLQPSDFSIEEGEPFAVAMFIGHAGDADLWGAARERVTAFESLGVGGVQDHSERLGASVSYTSLSFDAPGARYLTLETSPAHNELPADRFNAYADDEGLTPALAHRRATGEMDRPGREIYSRRVKSLVRSGDPAEGEAELITASLGHRLEVVLEVDPYALADEAPLPVRVEYEGRPLPGALIHLGRLDLGEEAGTVPTDEAGCARLDIPHEGEWVLNVVWTSPIEDHPTADFDTTFASLTFAFR
ncbi:MAG: DUF4198 domain-containing protein [Maricaulaceae bacterium]|jgi:uncharacterized GH25 family protein